MNSLLIEYNVCDDVNFILRKSMHLCMIRFVDNTSIMGGEEQQGMEDMDDHMGKQEGMHGGQLSEHLLQVLEGGEGGRSTRRETHEGGVQHIVDAPY